MNWKEKIMEIVRVKREANRVILIICETIKKVELIKEELLKND